MSLPARQERALNGIAGALSAGDPHLAGMFTIFARLNADDPVAAEPRARRRRWKCSWPGPALSALVLVPVAFALIVIGAVSGGARSVKTCVVAPLVSRTACQTYRSSAAGNKTTTVSSGYGVAPAWPPR
ncbi:MAG TPA: hypothetical protein VME19_13405 [Streptosporangiaceae bacterium]|nr:hypothetical protein [Streptosporangiaceae bacterium]